VFPLLLQGPRVQRPRVLSMLAGPGRSVGVAKALLQFGRLLVHLDRPKMRRQLPAFGQRRPLACTGGPRMWLLGCAHRSVTVVEHLVGMLDGLRRQPPQAVKHVAVGVALRQHGHRLPSAASRSIPTPAAPSMATNQEPGKPIIPSAGIVLDPSRTGHPAAATGRPPCPGLRPIRFPNSRAGKLTPRNTTNANRRERGQVMEPSPGWEAQLDQLATQRLGQLVSQTDRFVQTVRTRWAAGQFVPPWCTLAWIDDLSSKVVGPSGASPGMEWRGLADGRRLCTLLPPSHQQPS
jgi:hypothetical protein